MLTLPPSTRVFVATKPADTRRSFDGLLALVRDFLGHVTPPTAESVSPTAAAIVRGYPSQNADHSGTATPRIRDEQAIRNDQHEPSEIPVPCQDEEIDRAARPVKGQPAAQKLELHPSHQQVSGTSGTKYV